jgi:hypothetical protein
MNKTFLRRPDAEAEVVLAAEQQGHLDSRHKIEWVRFRRQSGVETSGKHHRGPRRRVESTSQLRDAIVRWSRISVAPSTMRILPYDSSYWQLTVLSVLVCRGTRAVARHADATRVTANTHPGSRPSTCIARAVIARAGSESRAGRAADGSADRRETA